MQFNTVAVADEPGDYEVCIKPAGNRGPLAVRDQKSCVIERLTV